MNSYMLPHGTREVARPRSTMHTNTSTDAEVHQRQTGTADPLVERALGARRRRCPARRCRGDDALRRTSSRASALRLRLYASSTASSSRATTSTTTDDVKAQSEYRASPMSMWSVFMRDPRSLLADCSRHVPLAAPPRPSAAAARSAARTRRPNRNCRCGRGRPARRSRYPATPGGNPNPDASPPHHQRHQQPGHHRQREHQHPHLGGVMGHLHVDERQRAVEPHNGAVVEPASTRPRRRLTRACLVSRSAR